MIAETGDMLMPCERRDKDVAARYPSGQLAGGFDSRWQRLRGVAGSPAMTADFRNIRLISGGFWASQAGFPLARGENTRGDWTWAWR